MLGLRAGITLGILLASATGFAQPIDCATLPSLCPSNPIYDDCNLPSLELASPCVVDFGDQRVVTKGTLRVPAGGVVSFKSLRVTIHAPIRAGEGAQVTLEGTDYLRVEKPISMPGGTLTLKGPSVGVWASI